jgi:hypothetical protein
MFDTVLGDVLIYTANRREEGVFISQGRDACGTTCVRAADTSYIVVD